MDWKQIGPYIPPILIVALIARSIFRAQQVRRVRPMAMWIGPVIVLIGMVAVFATSPMPSLFAMALFAVGAVAGGVVGYMRALHQEFSIEPETGNVMSKATPLGSILFLGLFVIRFGMNYWIKGGVTPDMTQTHAPNPQVLLYTDIMLFFAFAMVTASAYEVWRRTRPLILEHKATQALPPEP